MKALPASKEWVAFAAAREQFARTRSDADAAAMTGAWYAWRDSVEERRLVVPAALYEIEGVPA